MPLRDDRSTARESWRDLVARIRAGDEAAFEAMFRAYYDPLCRHVAPYLGSRDAAEDAVQGLFAEYFRRYIEAYRAEGVPIYAITLQNEPHYEPADYPGMRLDPPVRALLIGQYLGPLFARSGIGTIILDWDHKRSEERRVGKEC